MRSAGSQITGPVQVDGAGTGFAPVVISGKPVHSPAVLVSAVMVLGSVTGSEA